MLARLALLSSLLLAVSGCSAPIEHGLTEPQADEILLALGEHGIGATKEAERGSDGFAVVVLEGDLARALAVLREEGLPRREEEGIAEAYAEPSFVPTAGEERARMSAALAADLARSIETLAGVHDARVHVGLPDPSVVPMDDAPPAAVASVLIHAERDGHVDEAAVRALVAGAVPGLATDRVTVVIAPPRASSAPAASLVAVGPIYVTEGSARTLRLVLAALLGVNVLLAGAIGVVVRRRR